MKLPILRKISLFIALSTSISLAAQDLHYSLVEFMPMWTNPALTGAYEGTARVGGLYRDQWAASLGRSYQTPGFYVDAPIIMLGKKAWLGVGGTLISDQAGFAQLNTTFMQAGASYHRILNASRSSRTVLSIGLKGGVLQRSADLNSMDIILEEEQDAPLGGGLGLGAGLDRQLSPNSTGIDIGFGVSLARQIDADRNFRIGISGRHLTAPDYALLPTPDANRPFAIGAQFAYRQLLDNELLIEPQFYAQTTDGFVEAQLQGMVGRYLGEKKDKLFKVGVGYRLPARFAYPMVGYEFKDLKVAASFDISLNGIQQASGFQSGFEIGVQYIIKVYKQPKVDRIILCPQI